MCAFLKDTSIHHADYAVTMTYSYQAMGNDYYSPAPHDLSHIRKNNPLTLIVECAGRLVEDKNWWVGGKCPGNGQLLTLPPGQVCATFFD